MSKVWSLPVMGFVLNSEAAGSNHSFGLMGEVATPPTISPSSNPVMYGWQGMAYDAESGLWDNNAREYSPTIGRFTAIESMFQELGGVPRRLTSGNPKCFAAHYGVRMERLPPADPEKKGKIERPMPYVCRLYEAHGGDWLGLVATADEEMRWKR